MRRETVAVRLIPRRFLLASLAAAVAAVSAAACSGAHGSGNMVFVRVAPDNGAPEGGESVMILGSNFGSPASVSFGGISASSVQVVNSHTLTCTVPPHALGEVAVVVHAGGGTQTKSQGFTFIPGVEIEPQSSKGVNDAFSGYQLVPLDYDFKGYIGAQDDVDVLHIHTPFDGQVFISLDWSASYTSGGLAGLSVEYFHGPDPTPNPEAYAGGKLLAVNTSGKITDWMRLSYLADGHGPFLRIGGIGDVAHPAGFDPVYPYILHVHFVPDVSVEAGNPQDGFYEAAPITFASGVADLTVTASYDQDYDWFTFPAVADGWARVVLTAAGLDTDSSQSAVLMGATLFWQDPADPGLLTEINGVSAGDRPAPEGAVFETALLEAGRNYYLRLYNQDNPGSTLPFPYSYHAIVATGAGSPEALQPGGDLPAEVESSANVVAVASGGSPTTKTDYVFHEADKDWFEVNAPRTSLTVTWDHTAIRTALGDYDPLSNPLGGQFAVFAFNQAWFDTPGHSVSSVETINGTAFSATPGTNTHAVTISTTAGQNYWFLLSAAHGFDTNDPYTVSFTSN